MIRMDKVKKVNKFILWYCDVVIYRSEEEMQTMFANELNFLESCLRNNPKSYGSWHHRCFVMDIMATPDWKHELQLCNLFLEYDERNCEY